MKAQWRFLLIVGALACAASPGFAQLPPPTPTPKLTEAERAQVSRRGQRLDESKPGSGLGLSIVVDLAGLYGGSLLLGAAPIGGLRAELVLPGV